MAEAYPNTQVYGYDLHGPSIDDARRKAVKGNVSNVSFEEIGASEIPSQGGFDFAYIFDALHDMGDPVGVARHIRSTMSPEGTLMVVEPMAGDNLEGQPSSIRWGILWSVNPHCACPCPDLKMLDSVSERKRGLNA